MAGGPRDSNRTAAAKPKRVVLTKNQKRRLKKKQERAAKAEAPPAPAPAPPPPPKRDNVVVEYVSAAYDTDAAADLFKDVFAKFHTAEELTSDQPDAPEEEARAPQQDESDNEDDAPEKRLSRKQRKAMSRMTVAELKQVVARPEAVEAHDVTASDPRLLVFLKSYRNTVPVPRHWCHKRKFLQGKRGVEKKPFQLPEYIAQTGIEKIRRAVEEANDSKNTAAKQRDRVAPKMGRMDVDYQVLHDAFFKWQTKPPLSGPGEVYYEGKEFEVHLKEKRPGFLSASMKAALGMPEGAPPPWLINMQRYGPPPSYPNLRVAGLNAPIPEGASFGYHPGGWGKPPVDEYGRPLYGDVFGAQSNGPPEPSFRPEDTGGHWGELPDEDEEEDYDEDEGFEAVGDDGFARTIQQPPALELSSTDASETSGIETPLDGASSVVSGMQSSGLETPQSIDLRKRAGAETPESSSAGSQPLYQVIGEEKARASQAGTLFASDKRYNVSGVAASLDPEDAGDQNALLDAYQAGQAAPDQGVADALAQGTSAQKRKIDASRGKASKRRKEKDDFKF